MEITDFKIEKVRSDDHSFLGTIDLLKEFNQGQLTSLLEEKETIILKQDETLLRQGDPGESVFIVKHGSLNVSITKDDGLSMIVSTLKPGDIVGEMQILFDGLYTADVQAIGPATLLKFPKHGFRRAVESFPGALEKLTRIIRHRFRRDQLADILPTLFGPLEAAAINRIESMIEWVDVPAGQSLFLQNEESDSFYMVINGLLHAFTGNKKNPKKRFLRQMSRGDCIGEIGILSGKKRSASVFAARESLLVRFSQRAIDDIMVRYPKVNRNITKVIIERLQHQSDENRPEGYVKKIVIVPAGEPFPLSGFVRRFALKLARYGSVLHLSSEFIDSRLGSRDISQVGSDDPFNLKLSTWLEKQESRYDYILFESDIWASPWTRRCISHGDQIFLAGLAGENPDIGSIEKRFLGEGSLVTEVRQTLVLLHREPGFSFARTKQWLGPRQIKIHHHVCLRNDQDMERLARFATNRAVGLVLGGGGARGFAHIGVIRALKEAKIPIDIVGGTSMGAAISAQHAMGWDLETIMETNHNAWIKGNPFKDYTLPIYSVLTGRQVNKILKEAFGDTRIEELPINFFCVSSNLTEARPLVHQQGSLWKAVRASGSLPGIFQPWIHDSNLLVDGGIMNNLPGDVMKKLFNGFVFLVDVSPVQSIKIDNNTRLSPWSAALKKILPFSTPQKAPTMLNILIRTTLLSSVVKRDQVKKNADLYFEPPVEAFGLLEFKAMEEIIETGYRYTRKKLKCLEHEGKLDLFR